MRGEYVYHQISIPSIMIEDPLLLDQFQTLVAVFSRCENLTELLISSAVPLISGSFRLQYKYHELLECFTDFKSVRDVRFTDDAMRIWTELQL